MTFEPSDFLAGIGQAKGHCANIWLARAYARVAL
jgi:hypothetical protein